MEKSDLKDGMILVTRRKGNGILLAGLLKDDTQLFNRYVMLKIENLKNDLTARTEDYSIDKVYKIINLKNYSLPEILRNLPADAVKLIWERKREIDWAKVPKWTRVQINDFDGPYSGCELFVAYEPELKEYPFLTVDEPKEKNDVASWKYCRIHPDVDIKEEWYK